MSTKFITICLAIISTTISVFAQEKVEVDLLQKKMSEGNQTAFVILIPEAISVEMVQKEWKSFVNKTTILEHISTAAAIDLLDIPEISKKDKKALVKNLGKVETRGAELVVRNFLFDEASGAHIDVISSLERIDSGVVFNSFFKFSEKQFVEKTIIKKDVKKAISSYMHAFGVKAYTKVVDGQINAEEKKLKDFEKVFSSLERENKSLHKSIDKSEAGINEMNAELKSLKNNSNVLIEGLTGIAEALAGMTETSFDYENTKKSEKENLKEKKKNDKQISSLKSKIKKNQDVINDAKVSIEENLEVQSSQKQVIADQEKVVEQFDTKLSNIK